MPARTTRCPPTSAPSIRRRVPQPARRLRPDCGDNGPAHRHVGGRRYAQQQVGTGEQVIADRGDDCLQQLAAASSCRVGLGVWSAARRSARSSSRMSPSSAIARSSAAMARTTQIRQTGSEKQRAYRVVSGHRARARARTRAPRPAPTVGRREMGGVDGHSRGVILWYAAGNDTDCDRRHPRRLAEAGPDDLRARLERLLRLAIGGEHSRRARSRGGIGLETGARSRGSGMAARLSPPGCATGRAPPGPSATARR